MVTTGLLLAPQAVLADREVELLIAECDSLTVATAYEDAIAAGERALGLAESRDGKDAPLVATVLVRLGIPYLYAQNIGAAYNSWTRAYEIRKASLGEQNWLTAEAHMYTGILHDIFGSHQQAIDIFESALAVFDVSDDADPEVVADCLQNLALAQLSLGDYASAEANFRSALEIYRDIGGPYGNGVGSCLTNISVIQYESGDYAGAVLVFLEVLDVYKNTKGERHPEAGTVLENIGLCYMSLHQYELAVEYFERAIDVKTEALGADDPSIAMTRSNLGVVYTDWEKFELAEPLLVDAVAALESAYGTEDSRLASGVATLGRLYTQTERYDEAERYLQRALDIRKKALGEDHPRVATVLNNLGATYMVQHKYDAALECFNEALAISEKTLGSEHPDAAGVLENIASVHRLQGDWSESLSVYRRAFNIHRQNLMANGRSLSEDNALSYSLELHDATGRYLSAYLAADDAAAKANETTHVADALLQAKGQVSDVMFERTRAIVSERDIEVQGLAKALQASHNELSNLFVQGPGSDAASYRTQVDSLTALIRSQEGQLAGKSASFRRWRDAQDVSLTRVREQLPDKTALVEYVQYQSVSRDTVLAAYAALIIAHDAEPLVTDLGPASEIDAAVAKYRRHMQFVTEMGAPTDADLDDYFAVADVLYQKVWGPFADEVAGSDMIVICPDGALSLVAFSALPEDRGRFLLERSSIHYLSAARDLLRSTDKSTASNGLLAIGDPDYDAGEGAKAGDVSSAEACDVSHLLPVSPLPASRTEVERVAATWDASDRGASAVFVGGDATEAALKDNAAGARVVHLATHGYYISTTCGSGAGDTAMRNPLLLSGLFLSGANQRRAGGGGEDGVLTAIEVSSLDLDACELVVLSACETGVGEPEAGEGIYGLRRSFQMAGAATVVSALWSVADQDAARFASELYGAGDEPLVSRLNELQLRTIDELRDSGRPAHPVRWAAFVAQGDWR